MAKLTITVSALALTLGVAVPLLAQTPQPPENSQDKKRQEQIRKQAEIAEKNRKIDEQNAIVARTFNAGNEALKAKNYDEAIRLYDEGIAADPEQLALLIQKAVALKARGVDRYNAAIRLEENEAKEEAIHVAKKDFVAAADVSKRSVELIKSRPAPADSRELQAYLNNKYAAFVTYAEAMRVFISKVDGTQVDAGEAAYLDYLALVEADPAKKVRAQRDLAQMLFESAKLDKALAIYQKILEVNPDDLHALWGSGMTLLIMGSHSNDTSKSQEAANYLQSFVDKALDSDPLKKDAIAALEDLKKQNIKPTKSSNSSQPDRP